MLEIVEKSKGVFTFPCSSHVTVSCRASAKLKRPDKPVRIVCLSCLPISSLDKLQTSTSYIHLENEEEEMVLEAIYVVRHGVSTKLPIPSAAGSIWQEDVAFTCKVGITILGRTMQQKEIYAALG